jgi:hypothetical protein
MSDVSSSRISRVIDELRETYPAWRVGQLVANVAMWAKGPTQEAVWDVTDEEFIAAAESHLQTRRGETPKSGAKKAG